MASRHDRRRPADQVVVAGLVVDPCRAVQRSDKARGGDAAHTACDDDGSIGALVSAGWRQIANPVLNDRRTETHRGDAAGAQVAYAVCDEGRTNRAGRRNAGCKNVPSLLDQRRRAKTACPYPARDYVPIQVPYIGRTKGPIEPGRHRVNAPVPELNGRVASPQMVVVAAQDDMREIATWWRVPGSKQRIRLRCSGAIQLINPLSSVAYAVRADNKMVIAYRENRPDKVRNITCAELLTRNTRQIGMLRISEGLRQQRVCRVARRRRVASPQ